MYFWSEWTWNLVSIGGRYAVDTGLEEIYGVFRQSSTRDILIGETLGVVYDVVSNSACVSYYKNK